MKVLIDQEVQITKIVFCLSSDQQQWLACICEKDGSKLVCGWFWRTIPPPDTLPHFSKGMFVWNLESQGQVHCQTSQSYSTCFLPASHLFSKVPAPRKSFIPMSCRIKGKQWLLDSTKKSPLFQETPHAISTDVNGASVATFANACFKVAWLNNAVPSQLPPGMAFPQFIFSKAGINREPDTETQPNKRQHEKQTNEPARTPGRSFWLL